MSRVCLAGIAFATILLLSSCSSGEPVLNANAPAAPQAETAVTGFPASLPQDAPQPWESLDAAGNVIPAGRGDIAKTGSMINAESVYVPGVERMLSSLSGVNDNGEASRLASGDPGLGNLAWANYRITMGGEQPGAISADVNLLPMSDGSQSEYYIGLSNYAAGAWEWHGPFQDHHVRLSVPPGDYLSGHGNTFVCLVAYDGATFDAVGVSANPRDPADTTAPASPIGPHLQTVDGGIELRWIGPVDPGLAGYRIYYSLSSFTTGDEPGVATVPYLVGLEKFIMPAEQETFYCFSSVDISGNESGLSTCIGLLPLPGSQPDLRLSVSTPGAMVNDAVILTATGAESYDWDLSGDGIYDVFGDTTGIQQMITTWVGVVRPTVRGSSNNGSSVTCSGVSVWIGNNSRPLADGTATPAFGPAPLSVDFTGTGDDDDGTISSYSWDFDGDGTYDYTHATEPNPPAHLYTSAGLRNAKFRVEDNLGLTDVDTVAVSVTDPLNDPPTADLAVGAGEQRGNPPHSVNFDAGGSSDSNGTIVEYAWDFDGDGDYDELSATATIAHTYAASGSYSPVVRVEDDGGAHDTAAIAVSLNYPPTADLTADVTTGDPSLSVNFDAGGSIDSDGSLTDYEWDLDGDGLFNETGSEAAARGITTANYTYDSAGAYIAMVRVTDNEGLQATDTLDIQARGWVMFTIDTAYQAGFGWKGLEVINGHPAISYCVFGESVKYVRASSPTGANPAHWGNQVTIDLGDKGEWTALAEVDGNPAIAYYDRTEGRLVYVRSTTATGGSAADWSELLTVDDSADVGSYCSLAVVDGNPAISYYDSTTDDLKYVRATTATGGSAGDWSQVSTLDSTGDVGKYSSLVVVAGNPAISYYDGSNYDLKYARSITSTGASAGDWTQMFAVDSGGNVGKELCMFVVDGNPAISYYDTTNSDLKYARSTTSTGGSSGDWTQIVTVDSGGSTGNFPALAVIDGNPAISFYYTANADLEYVRSTTSTGSSAGDWTPIITVDATDSMGSYSSIAEVADGVAITYYDSTNRRLRYAFLVQ